MHRRFVVQILLEMSSFNPTRWVTSKSVDDSHIESYCKEMISNATIIDGVPMYTKEQMLNMFRTGYEEGISKRFVSPYTALRQMDVNDRILFPYEKWSTVRTSASKLKRQFGCLFRVRKTGEFNEHGKIEVVRIS